MSEPENNSETSPAQQPVPHPRWRRWLLLAGVALAVLAAGAALYLESNAFQERMRGLLITALERRTGTRVELRQLSIQWSRLQVELRGFVLHGRETAEEPPLFAAEWMAARWRLISFWNLDADLVSVRVLEPRIYVRVDESGESNLPQLPIAAEARGRWAAQLLNLKIGQLEVARGELRWNQRRTPLDFHAGQFQLRLDYEPVDDRYAGRLHFGDAVVTTLADAHLPSEADIQFGLYADHAAIESFEWRSAKSKLTLTGDVQDFASPRVEFRYDLLADWSEVGPFIRNRDWQGEIALAGDGRVAGGAWEVEGDLRVQTRRNGIRGWTDLPWSAQGRLKMASASQAASQQDSAGASWLATVSNLEVSTLGGRLAGEALVRGGVPGVEGGTVSAVDLEARNLSFPAMLTAAKAIPVRLDTLHWAGAVSGPLQVRFTGVGRNLTFEADWEITAAAVAPPGFTPVSGKLRGSYDATRKHVVTEGTYFDLPHTHLSGNGWFNEQASEMTLALNTTDIEETRTLAELVWKGSTEVPLRLDGRATAEVAWTGGTQRPRMEGSFRAEQFTYDKTRWDAVSGRLDYQHNFAEAEAATDDPIAEPADFRSGTASLSIRSGVLRRAGATLEFDLRLSLENGGFRPHSPFTLAARLRDARVADLEQMAGRNDAIDGEVDATFTASGTRQDPTGSGTVSVSNGMINGEPFDLLTASLKLEPGGVWTAEPIRLQKGGATISGTLTVEQRSERFKFDLSGSGVPLESVNALRNDRLPLAGLAEGTFTGEGTLDAPQIRGQLRIREFDFGAAQAGSLTVQVETRAGRAFWTAEGDLWGGQVRVKGETGMQGVFPLTADAAFENLSLPPLLRTFREPPKNLQGQLNGTLRAEGDWKNLSALTVRGELASLQAQIEDVSVHNVGPVPFEYQNQVLRLDRLQLEGPQLKLETSGTVRLAGEPALNLIARGNMDLAALSRFDPDYVASGRVELDGQISGTLRRPQTRGRLAVSDGTVHYGSLPNGLDRINGTIVFDGNRGVLENMTAETGGGRLRLSGFVRYETGWQFNLAGEVTDVRVRYPEGLNTWASGQLTWTGTVQGSRLEGRMLLTRQAVNRDFDLILALTRNQEEDGDAPLPEILRNMRLRVELVSATQLRLDTLSTRNLETDIELQLLGTAEQPVILGRIGITQGEILFGGKRYEVNRGEISFVNPFRIEPLLSLSVQARVQRYDISMEFSGPPDRLTVTYRSDPPLPTRDILSLLVAGSAQESSLGTTTTQPVPQIGADTLLSQALRSQISGRLDRLFGTGRLRVDPQISGLGGRTTSASIALEQQISDDVSILYITDVTSAQQQTIQAEWNISSRLSVVGVRDQNGLIGVNFQITLRFR